jgi:hypothetical protein
VVVRRNRPARGPPGAEGLPLGDPGCLFLTRLPCSQTIAFSTNEYAKRRFGLGDVPQHGSQWLGTLALAGFCSGIPVALFRWELCVVRACCVFFTIRCVLGCGGESNVCVAGWCLVPAAPHACLLCVFHNVDVCWGVGVKAICVSLAGALFLQHPKRVPEDPVAGDALPGGCHPPLSHDVEVRNGRGAGPRALPWVVQRLLFAGTGWYGRASALLGVRAEPPPPHPPPWPGVHGVHWAQHPV